MVVMLQFSVLLTFRLLQSVSAALRGSLGHIFSPLHHPSLVFPINADQFSVGLLNYPRLISARLSLLLEGLHHSFHAGFDSSLVSLCSVLGKML